MAQRLIVAMTDEQWRAHVVAEAAREIGTWLEARGRLHRPIRTLSTRDLEALAEAAIGRFVVLASERIRRAPGESEGLARLLMPPIPAPPDSAPSAAGVPAASATSTSSGTTAIPDTASAPCVASTPAQPSPGGKTA